MPRSRHIRHSRTLVLAVATLLVIVGGVFAAASGSDAPGSKDVSGGQLIDTDPAVIGSGGLLATPTVGPTSTTRPEPKPASDRTPTRPLLFPLPLRPTPTAPAAATPSPLPNQTPGPYLSIPILGVSAHVETKSTDANNVMQSPDDPFNVAWYDFTAPPGTVGNAVFAGHVDYVGVGKTVFWNLSTLRKGDEVSYIAPDGNLLRYRVTRTATAASNDAANQYVGPTSAEIITLITCIGNFDRPTLSYDQRFIVQAERIP